MSDTQTETVLRIVRAISETELVTRDAAWVLVAEVDRLKKQLEDMASANRRTWEELYDENQRLKKQVAESDKANTGLATENHKLHEERDALKAKLADAVSAFKNIIKRDDSETEMQIMAEEALGKLGKE